MYESKNVMFDWKIVVHVKNILKVNVVSEKKRKCL